MELKIVCYDEKYLPSYANDTDACMDLKVRTIKQHYAHIKSGETVLLGTGIQVAIPEDHIMLVFPRSSTGFKLNCMLANTTGVIDAGYRDEIKLAIHNFGNSTVELEDGQRIAQFVVMPRPKVNLNVVEDNDEFRSGDRLGGFGSTGNV